MKRTIIYVFGPKRLESLYYSNDKLEQKDGGWLKIGQTSSDDDAKDKREQKLNIASTRKPYTMARST